MITLNTGGYETYATSTSLVVYVSASKKTLLLPLFAEKLIQLVENASPRALASSELQLAGEDEATVKNVVTKLVQAELLAQSDS